VTGGKYSTKLVPTGFIGSFALDVCPTGWNAADGTNGTPDLRGAFLRGVGGDANGRDVVRALLSYQADEFKSHTHGYVRPDQQAMGSLGSGGWNIYSSQVTSAAGGAETRPKNVAVLYCVKN